MDSHLDVIIGKARVKDWCFHQFRYCCLFFWLRFLRFLHSQPKAREACTLQLSQALRQDWLWEFWLRGQGFAWQAVCVTPCCSVTGRFFAELSSCLSPCLR